jgi:hypothetical protein
VTVPKQQPDARPERSMDAGDVLRAEYALLMFAVTSSWTASIARTTLLLGVMSAVIVALGLVAQGSGFEGDFYVFGAILLPIALFLGLATFVRQVQLQRELVVYITGLNRIRHALQLGAPETRPYFVLPAHDDEFGIYRGLGAGMVRGRPRSMLLYVLVQAHGVVSVIDAAVAGAVAAIVAAWFGGPLAIVVGAGAAAFVVVLVLHLWYWQAQMRELFTAIKPLNPTPPDEVYAPF